jgi:hypothetical protein
LSKEKTHCIEFGRYARENAYKRGEKPKEFTFLGFTHYCGKTKEGYFKVKRRTSRKKLGQSLSKFTDWARHARNVLDNAKESFGNWSEDMLTAIHRCGYKAPAIRRVYIPKPGKAEKRPIGIPPIADRALQRSAARVLSAIYEEDFLKCSFGGRPGIGAHNALCTFNEGEEGELGLGVRSEEFLWKFRP